MDKQLTRELNLALIPDDELAKRHSALSQEMAHRYPTVIQLNGVTPRVAFTPHVTLYQVPVPVRDLPRLRSRLEEVADTAQPFSLTATEYGANEDEGSFEVR